jgi:hypothetical protein
MFPMSTARPVRDADNITAVCLYNVGPSLSHSAIGLHGLLLGWHYPFFTCYLFTAAQRESRDSSVGMATGYILNDVGVGFRVPVVSECCLVRGVQTGPGAHTASCQSVPATLPPGLKRPEREAVKHEHNFACGAQTRCALTRPNQNSLRCAALRHQTAGHKSVETAAPTEWTQQLLRPLVTLR